MKAIESVGGRFDVTGIENLRKAEGPLVIVANHMSALEIRDSPAGMTGVGLVTYN